MKEFVRFACLALIAAGAVAIAAEVPQAEISNGIVKAKLYPPDPETGYYRGTRFDWSGVIASLEFKGHNYFGQWFPTYDPKLNDAISGPVEDFRTSDNAALGFADAKPGETFIKIGVGFLRRPDDRPYRQAAYYEIVNPGKWTVRPKADSVQFVHELSDGAGYAYLYRKTVRLAADKPVLILEHSLKNTGKKVIETSVYEHDFYMIDGQPAGPDYVVQFPFEVRATADLKGMAEARGNEFHYLRELQQQPARETVYTNLEGFGNSAKDYDIRVENRKAGAGVRQTGDRPLSRIVFWSIRTTVCPEAYIDIRIQPGEEFTWRISYEFYTLPR